MSKILEAFERAFDNMSDEDLKGIYLTIQEKKGSSPNSHRALGRVPFVRDLFEMVESQYAYRSQHRPL